MAVVRPTVVYLLDFICSGIQFYLLQSPYLCFISFLYLDLYLLRDGVMISYGFFIQTKLLQCTMLLLQTVAVSSIIPQMME